MIRSSPAPASVALAAVATRTSYDAAAEAVQARVCAIVADVIAVLVSASRRDDVTALRRRLAVGDGPSTVVGSARGADPATAALLNGTPLAAEQLQDGHRLARGHPGAHVVPAVLAVAESCEASGAALLSAVLVGYEVGVRVGVAMNGAPAGVHDIGTWGPIGGAAGVAHLLTDGAPDAVAAAVDLAASAPTLPDTATVFTGYSGQHPFLGLGAHAGVVWGCAAAAGLRAPPETLERHFAATAAAAFDAGALVRGPLTADATRPHAVLAGYLKRHPSCAHLHGVNDAVEALLTDPRVRVEEVAAVEVRVYAQAAAFAEPHPAGDLAARFSIPWTVAAAMVTGDLGVDAFSADRLRDRRVHDLADRVVVRHDPALDAGYPTSRPAVVTVRLTDGTLIESRASRPRGDGPDALADADVREKPFRLLAPVLGADRANALLGSVEGLATDGVAPLTVALRAAAQP